MEQVKMQINGYRLEPHANLEYANLEYANLEFANLTGADLARANLVRANLEHANLEFINLEFANLEFANLARADLGCADLMSANLEYADLARANLARADLARANLRNVNFARADLMSANLGFADLAGANLTDTNLARANFVGANLTDTCLDPMLVPNGDVCDFFKIDNDWCIGYRTYASPFLQDDNYEIGQLREAHVFSVSATECHPGIFVLPTVMNVQHWITGNNCYDERIVRVIFRPWECHRAGNKWRVRWLIVWGNVQL